LLNGKFENPYGVSFMKKLIAVLILGLSLSSCGKSDTATINLDDGKGGSTKVSSKNDGERSQVTITGADGKTATMSSDAKGAKFPAFAPQYPGSTVTSATNIASNDTNMQTVTMTSSDSVDAVVAFYKESVTKAGMPIGMTGNFDGTGTLQAGKGEKSPSIMVSAAPKEGNTEISLILTNAG
jgi:major membrane immunogen (membrane-anchored lipoprotein)